MSDAKYVYVQDCYCDALGFRKDVAYKVVDEPGNGYYRLQRPHIPMEHRLGTFLIYKNWCHDATRPKKFEFPKELFEL